MECVVVYSGGWKLPRVPSKSVHAQIEMLIILGQELITDKIRAAAAGCSRSVPVRTHRKEIVIFLVLFCGGCGACLGVSKV